MPSVPFTCWTNLKFDRNYVWHHCPSWSPDAGATLEETPNARMWCVDFESRDDDLHGRNGEPAYEAARQEAGRHMEAARKRCQGKPRMFFFGHPWLQEHEDPTFVARRMRYHLMGADAVAINCYDDLQPESRQLIRASRNHRSAELARLRKPFVAMVSPEFQRLPENETVLVPMERLIVQVRAALTCRPRMLWAWSSAPFRIWQACLEVTQDHPAYAHVDAARKWLHRVYGAFPDRWTQPKCRKLVYPKLMASLDEIRRLAIENRSMTK